MLSFSSNSFAALEKGYRTQKSRLSTIIVCIEGDKLVLGALVKFLYVTHNYSMVQEVFEGKP